MNYEKLSNITLPKIGFGTSRLGGRIIRNRRRDSFYLAAMRSALELGYTHIDTAEIYALGYSEELIGRALREARVEREKVILTSKVWPIHLGYKGVLAACDNSLRRLSVDFVDLYLIHMPNPFVPLKESFRALNELVRRGKVRNLGVSNFGLDLLKQARELAETPLVTNQIHYSLTERSYVRDHVVEYCRENHILVTAYTPLDHGAITGDGPVAGIAKAHSATPSQVALAWLVSQPGVIAIPMSFDRGHQRENLAAADLVLSRAEMEQLDSLAA